MKVYLIEYYNNKELYNYLNQNYTVINESRLNEAHVIIVNRVYNIKRALDIIDFGLNQGKEVICIKNNFGKEYYVCNFLIKNGATYV